MQTPGWWLEISRTWNRGWSPHGPEHPEGPGGPMARDIPPGKSGTSTLIKTWAGCLLESGARLG